LLLSFFSTFFFLLVITLFILKVLILLYHIVYIIEIAVIVAIVSNLLLVIDICTHPTVPRLCNHLRLHHLALLRQLRALLNGVSRKDLIVSILFKFVSVVGDLLLVGDDADTLAAVEGRVSDLGLEGEKFDLGEVQVIHLDQIFKVL
jgi:hypothetical protein